MQHLHSAAAIVTWPCVWFLTQPQHLEGTQRTDVLPCVRPDVCHVWRTVQRHLPATGDIVEPGVWIRGYRAAIVVFLSCGSCLPHYTGSDFKSGCFPTESFDKPAVDYGMLSVLRVDLNARQKKKNNNNKMSLSCFHQKSGWCLPQPQGGCAIVSRL